MTYYHWNRPRHYGQPHRLKSFSGDAGAATPFDPLNLSNEFFFRGDSYTGTTSAVDTLEDLSSNNRDAALVAGTKWTATTSDAGVNNKPTFTMNASGYYRYLADGTNLIGTVNQAFYMYGVVRVPTTLTSPQWWIAVGWFGDSLVSTFTNASPTYARFNIGLSAASAPAAIGDISYSPASDTWVSFIFTYNGGGSATTASNWTMEHDGTLYTPAALAGLGIANVRNWVGARPGGTVPVGMRLAEVGFVKGTLSASDRQGLHTYWNNRYGFSMPVMMLGDAPPQEAKAIEVTVQPKKPSKMWKAVAIGSAIAAAAAGAAYFLFL